MKPILEDEAIGKVNQNIKYDWQVLKRNGVDMAGIAGDSMVADYLLHAGTRNHNLDALAMDHLQHRNISITELIGKGKRQLTMDQVPCARVAEYAGEDADVAWRLCEKLEPMLQELHFKRHGQPTRGIGTAAGMHRDLYLYDDLEIPLIEVLAEMEFTGIRLDMPLLARMSKEMEGRLAKLEEEILRAGWMQLQHQLGAAASRDPLRAFRLQIGAKNRYRRRREHRSGNAGGAGEAASSPRRIPAQAAGPSQNRQAEKHLRRCLARCVRVKPRTGQGAPCVVQADRGVDR